MRSLKARLTAFLLIGLFLLLAGTGLVVEQFFETWLQDQFDTALLAKAQALVTLTKQTRDEVELDFADEYMPEFEAPIKPEYFQIWLDREELLERSNSLGETNDLHRAESPPILKPIPQDPPIYLDVELPDGRVGRQVQIRFAPQVEDDDDEDIDLLLSSAPELGFRNATLVVAKSRANLDQQVSTLRSYGLLGLVALSIGVALVVLLALVWGLAPLGKMSRQLESLHERNLSSRIEVPGAPEEIQLVIGKINEMLHRLELAFERERRLAANVAHELRTPIAELRNLSEVGGRWPDDPDNVREFFQDALDISKQMERIVVNLLTLARYDGGLETVELEEVDLTELVQRSWKPHAPAAAERRLSLDLDAPDDERILADKTKLELIFANLFSNAVSYADSPSTIRCRLLIQSPTAYQMTVSNQASQMTPEDARLMFDRFWRKDVARTSTKNAGLGLSLVYSLADLHEFDLEAATEAGVLSITLTSETFVRS